MSIRTLSYATSSRRRSAVATILPNVTNIWKAPQQVDNFVVSNPELQPLSNTPQSKWINNLTDAQNIPNFVTQATAAGNKTLLLVIYAIPNRDAGLYSAGGFPDRQSYLDFLTTVKNNIGTYPAIISYEPDALGHANDFAVDAKAERIETLRLGVNILSTIPNSETYIDASMWIAVNTQADLLRQVDVSKISGFTLNTSGYNAQSTCYTYGNDIINALGSLTTPITGKKYIIDSARNGVGPLTDADRPLASPWLDRSLAWCNPPKRRTGIAPGEVSGQPNCRGTLWLKQPGESDGTFPNMGESNYYGVDAPNAGTFWVQSARDLLGLSPQPAGAGTISDIKADFTQWGPFTSRSAAPTLVNGRARIPVNTGYESIETPATYTLKGGTAHARIYAPAANGATAEASIIMAINSPTAGTRIVIARVDSALNSIQFGSESGYYDPNSVTIPYDATAHAWARIRESGGTTYWETSPDASNWTVRKQVATPAWAGDTKNQTLQFVTHRNDGTDSFAEVDNVNLLG